MRNILCFMMVLLICFNLTSCKSNTSSIESVYETHNNSITISGTDNINSNDIELSTKEDHLESSKLIDNDSNNSENNQVIKEHVHTYTDETITKQPSCLEQGIKTFYCSSCPSTKIEYIDSLGHNWANATCTSPKKCLRCNSTEGEKLEHSYLDNKCTLCGKEKISFNYEKNHFPIRLIEEKGSQKGKVDILNAQCYIKNEEIFVSLTFNVKPVDYGSRKNLFVKLVSSKGIIFANQLISLAWWNLPSGETTYDNCIVPWNDFCKLEPDEYQVIIEIS